MISLSRNFQTSVNIAYDLNNEEKVEKFISTNAALDIIEEYILDVCRYPSQRSKILVGPYGKGKSHLMLVIIGLLSGLSKNVFSNLITNAKEYKPELAEIINDFIDSKEKLLPIVIEGAELNLEQSFLQGLHKTLKHESLESLMPKNNYNAVLETIDMWEKSYPDTYDEFCKEAEKYSGGVDVFINQIKNFSYNTYSYFLEIYPILSSGGEFNPYQHGNVVEIFENISKEVKKVGYTGINIIYDEFSKYLESSMETASISEIKLLQDLAEKCERSRDAQMHLTLISHKEISNYIESKLPRDKADGWRGISGRFKHISYSGKHEEMYEIISNVIIKDYKKWDVFKDKNKSNFSLLEKNNRMKSLFGNLEHEEKIYRETVLKGCYPLHPISTYILPRLSEKVAQNERTLFTFLSSNQKYTLNSYLENLDKEKFDLLTPDYIYDYFNSIFRLELYGTEAYRHYNNCNKSLSLLTIEGKELEKKILKSISLFYIIDELNSLKPNKEWIMDIFSIGEDYDSTEIEKSLSYLLENKHIICRISDGSYVIRDRAVEDIDEKIKNFVETKSKGKNIDSILNDSIVNSYIYANKYNDDNELIRYFKYEFISIGTLINKKITDDLEDFGKGSNGIIYLVIPDNANELEEIKKYIKEARELDKYIFILPKSLQKNFNFVKRYDAIKNLMKSAISQGDLLSLEEYRFYLSDVEEYINRFVESYVLPEKQSSLIYYKGETLDLRRKSQLSDKLSDIFKQMYDKGPIIVSEFVNKNKLSNAARNSRIKVLDGLLTKKLERNLGLEGYGQDVSIMRSTLSSTGIVKDLDSDTPCLDQTIYEENEKLIYVLNIIEEFLKETIPNNYKNIKELYDILTKSEYGIGLKKGLIPIYLSVVIHKYIDSVSIKNGDKECKLTAELLDRINENYDNYLICLDLWDKERLEYVESLEASFSDYINTSEKNFNNFSHIVYAMNRWYMSLPKYSKDVKRIYTKDKGFINIDRKLNRFRDYVKQFEQNPRELLFEKIPTLMSIGIGPSLAMEVDKFKKKIDNLHKNMLIEVAKTTKNIFDKNENKSLSSAMLDWREKLSVQTLNHVFGSYENSLLESIKEDNNELKVIENMGRTVTSLRSEDWSDEIIEEYIIEIDSFKNIIEDYDKKDASDELGQDIIKLVTISEDGKEIVKTFEKAEYSKFGNLLKNEIEISIEEMGESIDSKEKRQILLDLLLSL